MADNQKVSSGLIFIGFISLACGIGGGIAEMILGLHEKYRLASVFKIDAKKWGPEWLQALGNFFETVANAIGNLMIVIRESPLWLGLTVLGLAFILIGYGISPKKPKSEEK